MSSVSYKAWYTFFSQSLCIINSIHIQIHLYISEIQIFISADYHNAINSSYFDHIFVTETIAITEQCKPS